MNQRMMIQVSDVLVGPFQSIAELERPGRR